MDPPSEVVDNSGDQPQGGGRWYLRSCVSDGRVGGQELVFLTTPPTVTPAELARVARSRMQLPLVDVVLNPSAGTLVGVPVWLALAGGWESRSASASVPGLSVSATATPTKVVWQMGDNDSRTCSGPGTVFRPGTDDPYGKSPTCGHTYRHSSGDGKFTVRATVSYAISWSGGGASGTLADLQATGTTTLTVGESQAIIAR